MAKISVRKVPVERLIVLITEHIEIYDMSNGLYHNTHHKKSIWKQIGLILECPCKYKIFSTIPVGSTQPFRVVGYVVGDG